MTADSAHLPGIGSPQQPAGNLARWEFAGLFLLTTATGVVDAASFLGLGNVFTANMTGNVLLLGMATTGSAATRLAHLSLKLTAAALGAFVLGALVGGRVAGRRGGPPRLAWGFLAEWTALVGALVVVITVGAGSGAGRYGTVALLGTAMGLQTTVVRRMGVSDVNTTVLTTILGGLAADVVQVGGHPVRVGRRVATVVCIFGGAAVGAAILQVGMTWTVLCALAMMTLGLTTLWRSGAVGLTHKAPKRTEAYGS